MVELEVGGVETLHSSFGVSAHRHARDTVTLMCGSDFVHQFWMDLTLERSLHDCAVESFGKTDPFVSRPRITCHLGMVVAVFTKESEARAFAERLKTDHFLWELARTTEDRIPACTLRCDSELRHEA